ncbi:MAG: hypothetical protein IJ038_06210 [Clostridia bacterium]|nr:hypothetical protein [Clostridia bacterium]
MSENTEKNNAEEKAKKPSKSAVILLVSLILLSVVVFGVYRTLVNYYYFEIVLITYMVIETVFVAVYLIYNRGFSRRGVTRDMLPSEWSEEKKDAFINSGKERIKKSRWMLVVILAFMFTFAIDIIELFVLPTIMGLFGL